MFTVFTEKNVFENVVICNDDLPNWYNIFCNHAEVYLNISKEEYLEELKEGTAIFEYIKANAGREPIPLAYHFQSIYDDPSRVLDKPRAVYLLNYSDAEAKSLQNKFGVIIQGENNIDDTILRNTYSKNLPQNSVWITGTKLGWNSLLNISLPPLNTIVISDNFLFTNEDGNRGTANFLQFIESILPDHLEIDFHILLLAQQPALKDKLWCERKVGQLKTELKNLNKSYPINFELVFAETIHKRIAISNYFILIAEKGFAIFKTNDLKTVHDDNDIVLDRIFNRANKNEGDTQFIISDYSLSSIKRNCKSVAEYISNRSNDDNFRILGDCNKDKSINNRLINDV